MYWVSHPLARERTPIPERIGLWGPLSGCELYHHSMGCYLVVKSATRPNKASIMACHNGQNVAVRSTTNNKQRQLEREGEGGRVNEMLSYI